MLEKSMAAQTARELSDAEIDSVSGGSLTLTDSETEPREIGGITVVLIVIDDSEGEP